MIRVAMIGVMSVFLALILRRERAEYNLVLIMGACSLLLFLSMGKVDEMIDLVSVLKEHLGKNASYVGILLKIIGITYVAEFSSNICSDMGYQAVANQIEFYGRLMILGVSVPIIMTLVETISNI